MEYAKPEVVQESEKNTILWYFKIQTDHLISTRRPDQHLINKEKNCHLIDFCHSSRPYSENKRKRKERQVLGPCQKVEKVVEHECAGDTTCCWGPGDGPQKLGQ